jgi:putative endonuclease
MKFYVYILQSSRDGTYYIGQTNNLRDRILRHNKGSIKSTKNKKPYKLCYFEEFNKRIDAMSREWEIKKKYNTDRRTKLISTFDVDKLKYLGL